MAKYFTRFPNALIIRLHILFDIVFGDSRIADVRDPSLFLKQCQLMAEHKLEMFLDSDLLKCFVREHEGETHEHVIELFVAEGDTNGRGAKPRKYFLDLTSRKIKVECGNFTIDSSPMEATEDYADQGKDALIAVHFVLFLAKMLIDRHPCYVPPLRP